MRTSSLDQDRIHIVMGLFNGARDLEAQLQSLSDQSCTAWDLTVSDDGSTDSGPEIVRRFADRMAVRGNRITLVNGPKKGFAANFLSLISEVPGDTAWVALADQDDVWLPNRLARGYAALAALPRQTPALYCSATVITDARLENRRASTRVVRTTGFRNALVQNIAAGNTILLNPAATALARETASGAAMVPGLAAHDWWLYLLVTGVGGTVIHDPKPTLLYRQHDENQVGANEGWRARMSRIDMLMRGQFADWADANIAALGTISSHLTVENRAVLKQFAALRTAPFGSRIRRFMALRLYRQSWLGQAALWVALLLRRI